MIQRTAVTAALSFLLLALAASTATAQGTVPFSASGRVLDPAGEPVACCLVVVSVVDAAGNVFSQSTARTRSDGSFVATNLLCSPAVGLQVQAEPTCCNAASEPVPLGDCVDLGTGEPLEHVDFGDLVCGDEPEVFDRVLITGRTVCRDGVFLEPVADCGIWLRSSPRDGLASDFTWTAADGTWEFCAQCEGGISDERTVEAQCCGATDTFPVAGCPEPIERPDLVCDPCPVPPCDEPREIEVRGRVVCPDPAGGPPMPIADCPVQVVGLDNCMGQAGPFEAVTDADGVWTLCMPCPAEGDCNALGATWTLQATPSCCPNGAIAETVFGCPPLVELPDNACPPDPGGGCSLVSGCATAQTRVSGVVTCPDPSGTPVPVAGCAVEIRCPGGVPVSAVTGPDGSYEACVPCAGCDFATVTALCCGDSTTVDLLGCPAEATADLSCADCPPPPRPCPPPDAVQVSGSAACRQPDGTTTPLAGCAVVLEPVSATGLPLDPVVTTSLGDGSFLDCVPCGPDGLSELTARAQCCGEASTVPVDGCPETLGVEPLLCDGCSPCPDGMTRLQGRVHCRGEGPVAGCRVRVNLETCEGAETFFAETDEQGRYRLCLPCPCAGTVVRVTAECCDGTSVREIEDCGPIVPMRTIHCAGACP